VDDEFEKFELKLSDLKKLFGAPTSTTAVSP
jgi:hypothetical protein